MAKTSYRSLSEYLERTGSTQAALADLAGVSQSQLSDYVRGLRAPKLEAALRLSEVTGVPVEAMTARRPVVA